MSLTIVLAGTKQKYIQNGYILFGKKLFKLYLNMLHTEISYSIVELGSILLTQLKGRVVFCSL